MDLGLGFITAIIAIVVVLAIWSTVWKALALWRAARVGSKGWFVVFLLINTLGILEIIYIYSISKKSEISTPQVLTPKPPGA